MGEFVVATFQVDGFLDYAFFTQYDADPTYYDNDARRAECEEIAQQDEQLRHDRVRAEEHRGRCTPTTPPTSAAPSRFRSQRPRDRPDVVQIYGGTYSTCGNNWGDVLRRDR